MHAPFITKKLLSVIFCSICLLSTVTSWGHEGKEQESDKTPTLTVSEQEISDFLTDYAQAFQSGDMQRIKTFFLADDRLSYFEGTFIARGWASHEKHLAEELPVFSETRFTISDIRPTVDNNLAFATYSWGLDTTVISDQFEGGQHPVSMRGIGTVVLVRDEDRWKIRHVHTAREPAAAPAIHREE